jgi:hypothetical protein
VLLEQRVKINFKIIYQINIGQVYRGMSGGYFFGAKGTTAKERGPL